MVCGSVFQVAERPARESDYSHPSRAKFKNDWSYTSNFTHFSMAGRKKSSLSFPEFHGRVDIIF
jgi:hypothetical protein